MTVLISFLVTILASTLRSATPLLLASLGGVFSERSGVVNIALEGIMLTGAWAGVYFSYVTGSALAGVLGAIILGMTISAIHAVASIHYHANQVVSGVAINLLAAGFTEFMMTRVWSNVGQSPAVHKVGDFLGINMFVYVAVALAFISHFALWRTRWGLRLRAVGEHPLAADTMGISVYKMRYQGVLLSGFFAGLAGASLSIGLVSLFTNGMTAGRGFIALAAMIFGKWSPLGAMTACLLFGAADAIGVAFQILGLHIPNQFLQMAPYVVTLLALAGVIGRSTPPVADGVPYDKSH
ncbi:MAG TPA: ABC transporter permease [Symbiobacteriaceae bacterium]|jgi:simple sugar transport system permease protein